MIKFMGVLVGVIYVLYNNYLKEGLRKGGNG